MLKIITTGSRAAKLNLLEEIKLQNKTWVVADLNTKSLIQTELLNRHKCLPENSVLRISELWQKILHQSFSDIEIVSSHFVSVVLAEWLKKRNLSWARHPGTPQMLTQYIAQFLPVLTQGELRNQMRDWLRENPETLMRWGNWFILSCEAWEYFCEEKMLSATWVSAYLSTQDWDHEIWQRDLVVDIGADILGVEIELFKKLAKNIDVTICAPPDHWCKKYSSTLWAYDILSERPMAEPDFSNENIKSNRLSLRYTTQIAEVKAAVSKVREWLDQGVSPDKLAVLAADIEQYWPSLHAYFQKEGVPVAKDLVMRAVSVPGVTKWISRIKIESRDIEMGDLEVSVFSREELPPIPYEKFRQLFNKIYDEGDLSRDDKIKNLFEFKIKNSDLLSRDEFFAWAIRFWSEDLTGIDRISAELLKECPVHIRLELRSWISYLTSLVAKIEIKLTEGPNLGIICTNFDAAQNLEIEHAIFLGLSESELQTPSDLSLTRSDVAKIRQDLGVYMESPDQRYNEYLADKITSEITNEVVLSFAATDFSGQAQAPSLFWLQAALNSQTNIEEYHHPGATRWDEIQSSNLRESSLSPILNYLEEDVGIKPKENFTSKKELRISPTQIEKYLKCPFIFAAEKVFSLSDFPDVDLDVDAMTSGQLMHAIFEKVLQEPLRLEFTDAELVKLIDSTRDRLALLIGEERLWPAKRQHYLRLTKKFIEFEKDWRLQYPSTHTIAKELSIKGRMQLADNISVEVSGRIDRVDTYLGDTYKGEADQKSQYVLIDYKSSAAKLHNYESWLKNDELQLAFYTLAITQGLTELPVGEVIGAFYYIIASPNRERGFRLEEKINLLFPENRRNRTQLSEEELQGLLAEVKIKIASVVEKINHGEFQPIPKDKKDCLQCSWSTVCRAPHLS